MDFLFERFWILLIFATLVNAGVWWIRGRSNRADDPSLTPGYKRLITGLLFWGNVPWVVVGLGVEFGGNQIDDYFHFSSENSYVVSFLVTIVILWALSLYWLLFRNGAETLAKHPGLLSPKDLSARSIKLLALVSIAGGAIFVAIFFSGLLSPSLLNH